MGLLRSVKAIFKSNDWEARKCLWPYPEGYATYNKRTRTILDTGLTKEQAERICDELNARRSAQPSER